MSAGKKFVSLDVHQDSIAIAVADEGNDKDVRLRTGRRLSMQRLEGSPGMASNFASVMNPARVGL